MKVKVGFTGEIFLHQQYGGVSRYVVELVKRLRKLELADATIRTPFNVNFYLRENAVNLDYRGLNFSRSFRGLPQIARAVERLQQVLLPCNTNVSHASYYDWELWTKSGVRIATFYDLIECRFSPKKWFHDRQQTTYSFADHCIAISQSTKNDMVQFLGADPAKVDVVYLASDIIPPTSEIPRAIQGDFVLWVGARAGYKNFATFITAFAESAAFRAGSLLVCAGGPQFSPTELEVCNKLLSGVDKVIHLVPDDFELATLYRDALVLVYASSFEGFGIPPLEAMRCSCPVVASNTSSVPEVVGDAGLLFDPTNHEEIADAIDRVVFESQLRFFLCEVGRQRSKLFSWEKMARETFAIYESAMNR